LVLKETTMSFDSVRDLPGVMLKEERDRVWSFRTVFLDEAEAARRAGLIRSAMEDAAAVLAVRPPVRETPPVQAAPGAVEEDEPFLVEEPDGLGGRGAGKRQRRKSAASTNPRRNVVEGALAGAGTPEAPRTLALANGLEEAAARTGAVGGGAGIAAMSVAGAMLSVASAKAGTADGMAEMAGSLRATWTAKQDFLGEGLGGRAAQGSALPPLEGIALAAPPAPPLILATGSAEAVPGANWPALTMQPARLDDAFEFNSRKPSAGEALSVDRSGGGNPSAGQGAEPIKAPPQSAVPAQGLAPQLSAAPPERQEPATPPPATASRVEVQDSRVQPEAAQDRLAGQASVAPVAILLPEPLQVARAQVDRVQLDRARADLAPERPAGPVADKALPATLPDPAAPAVIPAAQDRSGDGPTPTGGSKAAGGLGAKPILPGGAGGPPDRADGPLVLDVAELLDRPSGRTGKDGKTPAEGRDADKQHGPVTEATPPDEPGGSPNRADGAPVPDVVTELPDGPSRRPGKDDDAPPGGLGAKQEPGPGKEPVPSEVPGGAPVRADGSLLPEAVTELVDGRPRPPGKDGDAPLDGPEAKQEPGPGKEPVPLEVPGGPPERADGSLVPEAVTKLLDGPLAPPANGGAEKEVTPAPVVVDEAPDAVVEPPDAVPPAGPGETAAPGLPDLIVDLSPMEPAPLLPVVRDVLSGPTPPEPLPPAPPDLVAGPLLPEPSLPSVPDEPADGPGKSNPKSVEHGEKHLADAGPPARADLFPGPAGKAKGWQAEEVADPYILTPPADLQIPAPVDLLQDAEFVAPLQIPGGDWLL
jgi:hypothetical protein